MRAGAGLAGRNRCPNGAEGTIRPTRSRGSPGGRIPPTSAPAVPGGKSLVRPERGHAEAFCGVSRPPHSLALVPCAVVAPGMCPNQDPEQRAGGKNDAEASVLERCPSLGSSPKLPLSIFVLEVLPRYSQSCPWRKFYTPVME